MSNVYPFGFDPNELELVGTSYYIVETGEYAGEKLGDGFTVDSPESFEWFMGKSFQYESEIELERRKIRAITDAYERRIARLERRNESFQGRFQAEVEAYVTPQLTEKKRYMETPYGRCGTRKVPGGVSVSDPEKALAWAKKYGITEAIKTTKTFQISMLDEGELKWASESEGFTVKEPSVKFYVKPLGIGS